MELKIITIITDDKFLSPIRLRLGYQRTHMELDGQLYVDPNTKARRPELRRRPVSPMAQAFTMHEKVIALQSASVRVGLKSTLLRPGKGDNPGQR